MDRAFHTSIKGSKRVWVWVYLQHRTVWCSHHSRKGECICRRCRHQRRCQSHLAWRETVSRPALGPSSASRKHPEGFRSSQPLAQSPWLICLRGSRKPLLCEFCSFPVCSQQRSPWSNRGIARPIINKLEIKSPVRMLLRKPVTVTWAP